MQALTAATDNSKVASLPLAMSEKVQESLGTRLGCRA